MLEHLCTVTLILQSPSPSLLRDNDNTNMHCCLLCESWLYCVVWWIYQTYSLKAYLSVVNWEWWFYDFIACVVEGLDLKHCVELHRCSVQYIHKQWLQEEKLFFFFAVRAESKRIILPDGMDCQPQLGMKQQRFFFSRRTSSCPAAAIEQLPPGQLDPEERQQARIIIIKKHPKQVATAAASGHTVGPFHFISAHNCRLLVTDFSCEYTLKKCGLQTRHSNQI